MSSHELHEIAKAMVAPGKGILAADESTSTIERRLKSINVPSTEETRRQWRQLLLTAPGMGKYISGVILFDETLRQKTDSGERFVEVLQREGVIPGIKVDKGTKALAGSPTELVTEGLDGLAERLAEYKQLGAKFTKWRAVITIGGGIPTDYCIRVNAQALARYAASVQAAGLVPMVEPEVLMDGGHDIARCYAVTTETLAVVFAELRAQRVDLEGMILKPNMVLSGTEASGRAGPDEVAELTIRCFRNTAPAAMPGIAFLSGGQGDEEATLNMNAIGKRAVGQPWQLTYSFGRGLQATPLKAWAGKAENLKAGQEAFLTRARVTSEARQGKLTPQAVGARG